MKPQSIGQKRAGNGEASRMLNIQNFGCVQKNVLQLVVERFQNVPIVLQIYLLKVRCRSLMKLFRALPVKTGMDL